MSFIILLLLLGRTFSLRKWSNGRYETALPDFVSEGEALEVVCRLLDLGGDRWGHCQMVTPAGQVWTVTSSQVTDEAGQSLPGVTPAGGGDRVCGVVLSSAQEDQLGEWRCRHKVQESVTVELVLTTGDNLMDLRLPETFVPIHYDVKLIPDLDYKGDQVVFVGEVEMTVLAVVDTDTFTFHSDEITPMGVPQISSNLRVQTLTFDLQRMFVRVTLSDSVFRSGEEYRVFLPFSANIIRHGRTNYGFHPALCSDGELEGRRCWFTQLESTFARTAFPCLDEPALKATFSVSVGRREDYHARSNMPLLRTDVLPDRPGYLLDTFSPSVPMSTYLVAVVVTNYDSFSSGSNVTVWAPPQEILAGRANLSGQIATNTLLFFQQYFAIDYTLPKLDLVYEANKVSGMENWGLMIFEPRTIMLDTEAEVSARWRVINTITHETVHQWFGNLVTMAWWSQTWLNEGFAIFLSYYGCHYIDPQINSWPRFYIDEMQKVMKVDENSTVHWAMTDDTSADREDISRKFGTFTYQKGGAVIRMMEAILTRETFNKGIRSYLKSLAYSSAVEDDLFLHLEAAGLEDGTWPPLDTETTQSFSQAMKTWTNQPGLPVLTFSRSQSDFLSWRVRQEWLVSDQQPAENRSWVVPITFSTVQETSYPGWDHTKSFLYLDQDQEEMEFWMKAGATDWRSPVVFNVQGTGYYRVNYDQEGWTNLAQALLTHRDWIHPLNRAQIICDVRALAGTGHVSGELRDLVLSYIGQETHFAPLYAFDNCL